MMLEAVYIFPNSMEKYGPYYLGYFFISFEKLHFSPYYFDFDSIS